MTFVRARRIGRVFAVALLLWTAADLVDFGLCENSRVSLGLYTEATVQAAASPEVHHHGEGQCHDCFCCSPYVDVKAPFVIDAGIEGTPAVPTDPVLLPFVTAARLYHPPLA